MSTGPKKKAAPQAVDLSATPLPGTMMPRAQQERMVLPPDGALNGARAANDMAGRRGNDPIEGRAEGRDEERGGDRARVARAHYTDGGDKEQTIPI